MPEQSRAVTDAQGRYRYALAEDSTLVALIVPSTPETTRRTLADERPLRRGETVELDVGLPRGASLTGLVVDADARPVPHAPVRRRDRAGPHGAVPAQHPRLARARPPGP